MRDVRRLQETIDALEAKGVAASHTRAQLADLQAWIVAYEDRRQGHPYRIPTKAGGRHRRYG